MSDGEKLTDSFGTECPKCKGWGIIFIKAGIPNITETCPECKGVNSLMALVQAEEAAKKAAEKSVL